MNVLEDRLFREKSAELVSQNVAADAILITWRQEMYHMLCIILRIILKYDSLYFHTYIYYHIILFFNPMILFRCFRLA